MINLSTQRKHLFFTSLLLLLLNTFCFSQSNIDSDIKVQPASETARGGENFSYALTVTNIGNAKATDVILVQDEPKGTEFISYIPSRGKCIVEEYKYQIDRKLQCKLDDIEVDNSITVSVEIKFDDFDYFEPKKGSLPKNEETYIEMRKSLIKKSNLIGNIYVSAEEKEENSDNNAAQLFVEVLPSKNIAPRITILTPKDQSVFMNLAKKPTTVTFSIQAFDPDGIVERVRIRQFTVLIETPGNIIYLINGKKYTMRELSENKSIFEETFIGDAVKIGKDIYTFTFKNPQIGMNEVSIEAIDNGGRIGTASIDFTVKGKQ